MNRRSAHIAIFMLWEQGHLLPTLELAKGLMRRGHRVTYLTVPDLLWLPRSRGAQAEPILTEFYPEGSNGRMDYWPPEKRNEIFGALAAAARDEVVERQIEALAPDLVLIDSLFFRTYAERLSRRGGDVIIVTTSMPNEPKGGLPRLDTHRVPGGSLKNRLAIRWSWVEFFARQWQWYFQRHAPEAPPRTGVKTEEIILCPEELDFPRPKRRGRHFLGPCVEMDRPAIDFPWSRLNDRAKLIYCALGTQAHRYATFAQIAAGVIAAVAGRDDEQLVLVAGPDVLAGIVDIPPNVVVVVERAPQIELLRRAAVAITHGGLGTIKECILLGVPMIVFPQAFDQPGNAARIEFHGIGLRCFEPPFDGPRVRGLLDQIHGSASIRENTRRFQRIFEAASGDERGIPIIEARLARRGPATPMDAAVPE